MTKFITGQNLTDTVYEIIWKAEKNLLIVSPFIKLDDYFKKLFDNNIINPKIHILIVFGKNQNELSRSLSNSDFDYFKRFLNVSIVYVPNLHAKYYANESKGVITSINLYDFSFRNNIEYGVYYEKNLLNKLKSDADDSAWAISYDLAEKGEVIFIKRPVYQKKFLSSILGKNYVQSNVLHDTTEKFYGTWNNNKSYPTKRLQDFDDEVILGSTSKQKNRPEREENVKIGYCIRTGKKIPYNIEKPYSNYAYTTWKQFKNEDYPEKYCHKTGKESFGKTSMRRPIL